MKPQPDRIEAAGLRFFGRMSASISHELKNVLAIIKENSGLLNDYLLMMAKGMPVDPQRFKTVADRIHIQTARADNIIKNLNQFAHTIDNFDKRVDANEILALLIALHQRAADMKQVSLTPKPSQTDACVTTAPFTLLNALGLALIHALENLSPGASLAVEVFRTQTDVGFSFSPAPPPDGNRQNAFPADREKPIFNALNAKIQTDPGKNKVIITLPRNPKT